MDKLKTLNEIQLMNKNLEDANRFGHLNWFRDELKTEAIKWIKKLEEDADADDDTEFSIDGFTCNVIDWIKHFFNISEDDLK